MHFLDVQPTWTDCQPEWVGAATLLVFPVVKGRQKNEDMLITVRGHHECRLPPERGTLTLDLGFEADQPTSAMRKTQELAGSLDTALTELRAGPVSWYSLDAPTMSVWRPYNDEGRLSPPRYRASAEMRGTFSDFIALSTFVATWGETVGVTMSSVEWTLTDETRDQASADVLARAVLDAQARAKTIADALQVGLGECVEVADPGLLSAGPSGRDADIPLGAARMLSAAPQTRGVDLHPEMIVVEATVHARFQTT